MPGCVPLGAHLHGVRSESGLALPDPVVVRGTYKIAELRDSVLVSPDGRGSQAPDGDGGPHPFIEQRSRPVPGKVPAASRNRRTTFTMPAPPELSGSGHRDAERSSPQASRKRRLPPHQGRPPLERAAGKPTHERLDPNPKRNPLMQYSCIKRMISESRQHLRRYRIAKTGTWRPRPGPNPASDATWWSRVIVRAGAYYLIRTYIRIKGVSCLLP